MHSVARLRSIPVALGALVAALALALFTTLPVAADATLTTVLTGDQEVPGPGDPDGSGVGLVDITTGSGEICVTLNWEISDPQASAAHIHEGAAGTAPADNVVLALFTSPDADGFFEGCFTDATLAAEIEADPDNYYLNIHSENHRAGAIRGQLGVQAASTASSYINPDTGLATENPNVDPASSCETPDQTDTQAVSPAGETTNNVHTDACLFDDLGLAVDAQASFQVTGVGVISACPDPDGAGTKTATLSGGGTICTLSGYQETGAAGDFEYHVRTNSEVAGTQTVTFCVDPEGNGCGDATISDANTITWFETGMIMIMKHYCNADDSNPDTTVDVRSEEEFMEVEAGGGGDPVVAVALTVLACPVERLPGDEPVADTIAHFEEEFDFNVTDELGNTFTLADGTFTQLHACEQERADGPLVIGEVDGDESTNVCVDFSFYAIEGVAEGDVTVVETFHEGEHEFGTVRFTPAELDPDDDSRTLLGFDRASSTVNVDTSRDGDAMVMLHIYNFDTAVAGAPAPTPTPAAPGQLPDTASPTTSTGPWAVILAMVALGSMTLLAVTARNARRSR